MANFTYPEAMRAHLAGEIDFDTDDLRGILVMTNTTADTEITAETIDDFSTLDEMDGSGYVRTSLGTVTVVKGASAGQASFQFSFALVSAGTRNVQALIIYKHVNDDTDSIPIMYIDTASGLSFPITPIGANITFIGTISES